METRVLKVTSNVNTDTDMFMSGAKAKQEMKPITDGEEYIREAGELLKAGELVAFPTETVYGLGGDGLNPSASEKIYAAKGRPSDNPLIIHIANADDVKTLVKSVPEKAKALMDAFWPGPLTLIMEKSDIVPKETTGGLNTVAIRCPAHPVANELIRQSGVFIAAPSANSSGRPSPTKAEHVYEDLKGRIPMILDGGAVDIGVESTIVDVTREVPVILRPGFLTKEMLERVIGEVIVDPAILEEHAHENMVAIAPGMKYKHYAPKGELTIVENGDEKKVYETINELSARAVSEGRKVGVIGTDESLKYLEGDLKMSFGSRSDLTTIAHNLFDVLRQMDEEGAEVIYCEGFTREALGQAIMNRLLKAAGYKVIRA